MVSDLPTLEEGQQRMWEYFDKEIARLTERKKLVESREQRRLQAALQEAQAPVDRAAVTRARYSADSDRVMFSGIRLLEAIKKERRKHGDDDPEPPTDADVKSEPAADSAPSDEPRKDAQDHDEIQASDPVGSSLVEAFAEALTQDETGDLRNDAVESQVVDGVEGNEASPPTPGGTPGTVREALAPAEPGDLRNDAVEPQVVDGIGGNEASPATSGRHVWHGSGGSGLGRDRRFTKRRRGVASR